MNHYFIKMIILVISLTILNSVLEREVGLQNFF